MSFDKYKVIRKAVDLDLINFIKDYFFLKRKAVIFMNQHGIIDHNEILGTWNDPQIPNTYSHYADPVMETLLTKMMPTLEKHTGLDLIPTYSYARIYKMGDKLNRHKDRNSCEISTTLHLGGNPWPIYLEPSGKEGLKGKEVNLKPGDMLVYKGCEVEHWRETFTGKECAQVFLHYNDKKSEFSQKNKFDNRPLLGVPSCFKKSS